MHCLLSFAMARKTHFRTKKVFVSQMSKAKFELSVGRVIMFKARYEAKCVFRHGVGAYDVSCISSTPHHGLWVVR